MPAITEVMQVIFVEVAIEVVALEVRFKSSVRVGQMLDDGRTLIRIIGSVEVGPIFRVLTGTARVSAIENCRIIVR